MRTTALCISDAHAGIQAAVRKDWLGASWQRCKVHFMRNILARVPHKEKGRFSAHLKQIWLEPDKQTARRAAEALIEDWEKRVPEAIRCLEEGLEDSLTFYDFPEVDRKKISSTNGQERLHELTAQ
jgi:transposase-like protein